MHAVTQLPTSPPRSQRLEPLAQVELLLLFHPGFQGSRRRRVPAETCAQATQGWLTLDVYGRPGVSDLTGRPVMEDLRLEVAGEDLESLLPDGIVNRVADYLLQEA